MNNFRTWIVAGLLTGLVATSGQAQERKETLADIRQEMSFLYVEIQKLNQELSTTGNGRAVAGQGSSLQRLDALEGELRRITGKVEELEFRIQSVVKDGTNRLGDLEFRLVELEGGDVSNLGQTSTLGGVETTVTTTPVIPPDTSTNTELAVSEQVDFQKARDVLAAQEYQRAAELFALFTETYPGGPLTPQAHYLRGDAQAQLGQWSGAARSYLQSFSSAPDAATAPDALYRLGVSLDRIGQREEACLTLNEVGLRYPDSEAASKAQADISAMGCGS